MNLMVFWLDFCVCAVFFFIIPILFTQRVRRVFKLQLPISVYVQGVICVGARTL